MPLGFGGNILRKMLWSILGVTLKIDGYEWGPEKERAMLQVLDVMLAALLQGHVLCKIPCYPWQKELLCGASGKPQQERHSTDPQGSGPKSYNCRKELYATQKKSTLELTIGSWDSR